LVNPEIFFTENPNDPFHYALYFVTQFHAAEDFKECHLWASESLT